MKTKLTLITLIACAAAGTAFAADPVRAFRASSGTTTNSADTIYVGNTDWGSDSKEIGEKYFKDLNLSHGGTSFTWDEAKKAFYDGFENWSFDTIFALTGTASFVNESNSCAVFQYAGDKKESDGDMDYENTILFADSSKFENRGEFLMEYEVSDAWSAPRFVTWLRDDAVFENSGLISSDYRYSDQSLRPALDYFLLAGNSKLINTESGEIRIRDENNPSNDELDFFRVHIYENSTFENAGTVRLNLARLAENGCFLNTGTVVSNSGAIEFLPKTARPEHNLVVSNSGAIEFLSREGWSAGTPRVENRGEMTVPNIKFIYVSEEMTERSALVENYGTWSSSSGGPINIEIDYDGDASTFSTTFKGIVAASDLQVKNYGTISAASIILDSGVKLTLGEGSNIDGNVAIGSQIRYYQGSREFRLDKDVLNIVLTGKGGSDALISGGLEVCNLVELNVSLAEDAVKKTKYELTIWGGELTLDGKDWIYDPETGEYIQVHHDSGFIKTTGTLDAFGTTYEWSLDTATGVLTAKDVNIGEEIDLTSPTQNVELGEKDVATLDPSLTEYSGNVSGAGQVSSSGDVEFSGDASALTGTLSVDAGTFTIAESAKLGEKATLDVAGTLALEGARTIANATSGAGAIELAAGATVKFAKEVGVKTLNVSDGATLRGGVKLTRGADAVLTIAGTLALDAAAGEKVALGTGKTVLAPTAKLRLDAAGGNAAGASFMAAGDAAPLENGGSVVIFENGTVEGDVVAFLGTDQTLAALAAESAVIYDATNGLSVRALTNPEAFANGVDTSDLSSSFVGWALGGLEKELANLQPGFVAKDDLGGLDSNDPLLNALLAGDAGTARSILDRLSPKSFAAMIAMPVETFHDDVRSVAARLEQRRHDAAAGVDGDWQFFAQAQMISAENDTASDAPTFDFDRYGALAGADVKLDETMLLGVAVGAGTGDADIHNGGGKIESTDFRALAYFGKTFAERFYVNAGAQLGFASYDVKRRSDYGDANADVDGWNAGAFAEAGAAFAISETHGLYATPYVGLAYAHAETDSFTESGSDRAAFDADALEGDSLRARIGCAFSWDFALASTAVRLGLDVAYSRELLDDEIDVDVRSGSDEISETAAALPEDVFSIGPTLDVALTASASVYAGYAFQAGTDSSTAHRANVGFRLRF